MELLKNYKKTGTNKVSVENNQFKQNNFGNNRDNYNEQYAGINTIYYSDDDSFETDSYSGSYSGESGSHSPIIGIGQTDNSYDNSYNNIHFNQYKIHRQPLKVI